MIKIENTEVMGWEHAIRGMRNPMNSWDKSDSGYCFVFNKKYPDGAIGCDHSCPKWSEDFYCGHSEYCKEHPEYDGFLVGDNDLELMRKLTNAGSDHGKFMRMLVVYTDITCHHTWWAEFDTYKVGTVRNSCSKMHKIHIKEFVPDDFSHEGIDEVGGEVLEQFKRTLNTLEWLRVKFNETNEKKYWRAIIELLPMGFNIKATVMLNYEVLKNMYHARLHHKLDEWRDFCEWIETLPYSELITGKE